MQSALNNLPSAQRSDVPPLKANTCLSPSLPLEPLYRSTTAKPNTIAEVPNLKSINCKMLTKRIGQLQPLLKDSLQTNHQRTRESMSKRLLSNFTEGDFVLVANDEYLKSEKLSLRWLAPRRTVKQLNDFSYFVEGL